MSATQPVGVDSPRRSGEDAVKRELDALANGEIDHVSFLNAMKERFRFEPDENWEVLSLLDQYYRRGKIPLDVFRAIKNGFAEYILGPQVAMPTLHKVAAPTQPPPAATSAKALTTAPPAPSAPHIPATAPTQAAPAPAPHVPAAAASVAPPTFTVNPTFTGSSAQPSVVATKANSAQLREVGVGDVLRERYRVEAILARAGSGSIFEVSDAYRLNLPPSGKRLAVKVSRMPDPRGNFLSQLRHEFHSLQYLSHPNIVRAFDFDRDGALSFFTMELLNGVHLTQVFQGKSSHRLPRQHALTIIRDIGSAVVYAHSRGVIHGDINPQNVFITMGGEIRLLGFGAAHKLSAGVPTPDFERASAASDTHRYASCEVFEGNRPDAQDDIYSLSCVAYLLLKGKHPYADSTSIEARASRLRPRRPAGLSYKQWLTLRAGLRTDAKKRPASVREWLEAMGLGGAAQRVPAANELMEARADKPRRLHFLAAAVIIAALIGLGYWYSVSNDTLKFPPLASESASKDPAPAPSVASSLSTPTATAPAATAPAAMAPAAMAPQHQLPAATLQPIAKPAPGQAAPRAATPAVTAPAPAPGSAASGATRIEMAIDTLDALPTDTAVHVTVRRKGNLRGTAGFTWWTESGTAKPGTDFSPVLPHVEQMRDGESSVVLTVPLIPTLRAQPKGFYVGIESTDGGAQIGARALTQITLPPTN
jgi:serine/threonine protein kinase